MFRAWHVLPDTMTNPDGHPVNVVTGFCDFALQLLQRTDARYIAFAFDTSRGSKSTRTKIYPEYKANRPAAPPELKQQFQWCRELIETFGMAQFADEQCEADDIIGTFAAHVRRSGLTNSIVTADKDLAQFIEDDDEYWNYARELKMDTKGIIKRFGVRSTQIADMLALCGDKVDNIPGIPGVGETTAARLLVKWGNLDTLFEHTSEVATMKFRGAAGVAKLLNTHEHTVRLARRLTGLIEVDSLNDNIALLQRRRPDTEKLKQFLSTLGFSDKRQNNIADTLLRTLPESTPAFKPKDSLTQADQAS